MDLVHLGRQALERIRSQRGKSLLDNTLYYDNAYISVYKEKGGTSKPVEESPPSSTVAEPQPEKISFLEKSEKSEERSAPPSELEELSVPGCGSVFVVAAEEQAARLNLPPGRWLTRADMESLSVFTEPERIQILRIMAITGARVAGVTNLRRKQ
jgi:hypothetical protein